MYNLIDLGTDELNLGPAKRMFSFGILVLLQRHNSIVDRAELWELQGGM